MLTPMGMGLRRVQKAATPFTLTPFYRNKVGEGRENGLHYARAIALCGFIGCCIVVLGGRGIRFLDCWRQPQKHPKRDCTALWGICDFLSSLTYIGLGCSHFADLRGSSLHCGGCPFHSEFRSHDVASSWRRGAGLKHRVRSEIHSPIVPRICRCFQGQHCVLCPS